jgi:hypothetical protein
MDDETQKTCGKEFANTIMLYGSIDGSKINELFITNSTAHSLKNYLINYCNSDKSSDLTIDERFENINNLQFKQPNQSVRGRSNQSLKGRNKQVVNKKVSNKQVADKRVFNKQVADKKVSNKQVADKKVFNKQVADKKGFNKRVADKKVFNKQTPPPSRYRSIEQTTPKQNKPSDNKQINSQIPKQTEPLNNKHIKNIFVIGSHPRLPTLIGYNHKPTVTKDYDLYTLNNNTRIYDASYGHPEDLDNYLNKIDSVLILIGSDDQDPVATCAKYENFLSKLQDENFAPVGCLCSPDKVAKLRSVTRINVSGDLTIEGFKTVTESLTKMC